MQFHLIGKVLSLSRYTLYKRCVIIGSPKKEKKCVRRFERSWRERDERTRVVPKRETKSAEKHGDGEREGENLLRNGIKITALSAMSTNRLVIPV